MLNKKTCFCNQKTNYQSKNYLIPYQKLGFRPFNRLDKNALLRIFECKIRFFGSHTIYYEFLNVYF